MRRWCHMRTVAALVVLVASPLCLDAAQEGQSQGLALKRNPIRRVVSMLQSMVKKVEAQGQKEQELFDKFICYCKTSGAGLSKSISDAETKIPQLVSDIQEAEARKTQLDEDVKSHQADRAAAKAAVSKATSLREKEAAKFSKERSENMANIAAVSKAIKAIERGLGGSFLQSPFANVVLQLVQQRQSLEDTDREVLTDFLSGTAEEGTPGTGEVVGILKTMRDEMSKDSADATATEQATIMSYGKLKHAKTKQVKALSKAIEEKIARMGELAIEIEQMRGELGDTEDANAGDKRFLANLDKNCATKQSEWDELQKVRSQEVVALSDTIKVLNDDDALDIFKKTLPGAASFVQLDESSGAVWSRARDALHMVQRMPKRNPYHLDFIALAMHGKKAGFESVIKMIGDMVLTLKKEQSDDEQKKEYCTTQFAEADDKKRGEERSIRDLETVIANAEDGISALEAEIKVLGESIKALDAAVAGATQQRKEENAEFTEMIASDSAAKEIILFAKNRLNKFYNPKQYAPPPKQQLSEEDRITLNNGGTLAPTAAPGGIAGTGITALAEVFQHGAASEQPAAPPETPGAYKKSEESGGVLAMLDILVRDLDREITVARTEEKDAQADYEQLMKDSQEKRAGDVKSLAAKEKILADLESSLEATEEDKSSSTKELMAQLEVVHSLHGECDWLMQNFDVRREARTSEIDALGNAKAVLNGADYSLVQTSEKRFLRLR